MRQQIFFRARKIIFRFPWPACLTVAQKVSLFYQASLSIKAAFTAAGKIID
ncbi:hypothetical protein CLOLEP_01848 [[Clostridium] leptum DSM 753]|uniref:Uncharacterized protein n=1 Tax=[Clostridium] leptum DSM 753 TaxID=428125 RepID=A7VTF6_9FIRM|nr:hypothetical protein CLOLEP_01848 [[Clostridium] leptum DSM 753]